MAIGLTKSAVQMLEVRGMAKLKDHPVMKEIMEAMRENQREVELNLRHALRQIGRDG